MYRHSASIRPRSMVEVSSQYLRYPMHPDNDDTTIPVESNIEGVAATATVSGTLTGIGANVGYCTFSGDNYIRDETEEVHNLLRFDQLGSTDVIIVMFRLWADTDPTTSETLFAYGESNTDTGFHLKMDTAGKLQFSIRNEATSRSLVVGSASQLTSSQPQHILAYIEKTGDDFMIGAYIGFGTTGTFTVTDPIGDLDSFTDDSAGMVWGANISGADVPQQHLGLFGSNGRLSDGWVIRSTGGSVAALPAIITEYANYPYTTPRSLNTL